MLSLPGYLRDKVSLPSEAMGSQTALLGQGSVCVRTGRDALRGVQKGRRMEEMTCP